MTDQERIKELEAEVKRLKGNLSCVGIHTCHEQCENPMCLLHKKCEQLEAECLVFMKALRRYCGCAKEGDNSCTACKARLKTPHTAHLAKVREAELAVIEKSDFFFNGGWKEEMERTKSSAAYLKAERDCKEALAHLEQVRSEK